jgi:hypothetical protein
VLHDRPRPPGSDPQEGPAEQVFDREVKSPRPLLWTVRKATLRSCLPVSPIIPVPIFPMTDNAQNRRKLPNGEKPVQPPPGQPHPPFWA